MANLAKLETESEVKCDADKFFNQIRYSLHHLPSIFPETYKSSELLEGDGNSVGTVRLWKYVLPGTTELLEAKETIEELDVEKRCMTLTIMDGHLKNHYSVFVMKIHVNPKGNEGCKVKWVVEYEKAAEGGPDPHQYIDLFVMINQKLDAHLLKA